MERYPDQYKLLTMLGFFLYYQGKSDEALQALNRAVELSGPQAEEEPMILSAIVLASRGERDKINPRVFRYKPEDVVDGDLAEWIGSVYALFGEKEPALGWLRQAVRRGDHNFPWYQRDKNWDKLRNDPDFQRIMNEVEGYWKHYVQLFGQMLSRTTSGLAPSRSMRLECMVRKLRKSTALESPNFVAAALMWHATATGSFQPT